MLLSLDVYAHSLKRTLGNGLGKICATDHVRKIRDMKQITDMGKCSFLNRTIKNWNQVPPEALETFLFNQKN